MKSQKIGRREGWFVVLMGLALVLTVAWPSAVYAEPPGVDIKIRAQNRSTDDTPFCGIGAGHVGDRLDVDAFMDPSGVVTGTARFEDADGNVTIIDIDTLLPFGGGGAGGGLVLQDFLGVPPEDQDVVAIWMDSTAFAKPTLVNVELPRGCGNTVSTFTPGVDKVTVQIKFR